MEEKLVEIRKERENLLANLVEAEYEGNHFEMKFDQNSFL